MTAISIRQRSQPIAGAASASDRLGYVYPLLLVWVFFEFGRPSHPFNIPLVISLISLLTWLVRKEKQWTPATKWWLVVIGGAALGIPFANNTYSAFWTTYNLAVLFLSICLPLQSLITSVARVRLWFMVFLATTVWVGVWAASQAGIGPNGALDENYVATLMDMAIAVAFFMLFAEKATIVRGLLAFSMAVFVAAIALGGNPSRGGFIALCAVALYGIWRSPRKLMGISGLAVVAIALLVVAGPGFWTEIGNSTDTSNGSTGDIRLEIWKAGLRMWMANPILGVGAGNFRWAIGDYQTAEQFAHFQRSLAGSIVAHSMWVEALAELGLVGVIATAILVWRTWTDLGRMRNELTGLTSGPSADTDLVRLRCYADAIRAGILAVLVNGVFLSLFYYSDLWVLLALGSGMTTLYRSGKLGPIPGATTPRPVPAQSAVRWRGGAVLPVPPPSQRSRIQRRGRR